MFIVIEKLETIELFSKYQIIIKQNTPSESETLYNIVVNSRIVEILFCLNWTCFIIYINNGALNLVSFRWSSDRVGHPKSMSRSREERGLRKCDNL